jgi:hypothetical protein
MTGTVAYAVGPRVDHTDRQTIYTSTIYLCTSALCIFVVCCKSSQRGAGRSALGISSAAASCCSCCSNKLSTLIRSGRAFGRRQHCCLLLTLVPPPADGPGLPQSMISGSRTARSLVERPLRRSSSSSRHCWLQRRLSERDAWVWRLARYSPGCCPGWPWTASGARRMAHLRRS